MLSATGRSNNQMSINTWNVRPYSGKKATIQVVDNHTAGWGNIGIDHIVFQKVSASKEPSAAAGTSAARRIIRSWQQERDELASRIVRKSRVAPAMLDGTGEESQLARSSLQKMPTADVDTALINELECNLSVLLLECKRNHLMW